MILFIISFFEYSAVISLPLSTDRIKVPFLFSRDILIDLGKQDQSIQADTEASTLAQVLYQMWLGAALLSKLQKDKTPLHQALRATKFLLKSEDS